MVAASWRPKVTPGSGPAELGWVAVVERPQPAPSSRRASRDRRHKPVRCGVEMSCSSSSAAAVHCSRSSAARTLHPLVFGGESVDFLGLVVDVGIGELVVEFGHPGLGLLQVLLELVDPLAQPRRAPAGPRARGLAPVGVRFGLVGDLVPPPDARSPLLPSPFPLLTFDGSGGVRTSSGTPGCQVARPSRTSIRASATLRMRWRSWVTSSTVPGYAVRASSSTSQLGRSRWLVGSSSTSRLTGSIIVRARASRVRSPPERSLDVGGRRRRPGTRTNRARCAGCAFRRRSRPRTPR